MSLICSNVLHRLKREKDEHAWKTAGYVPWLIRNDRDIKFMFRIIVEDNILYMCVRSICKCV